MITRVLVEAGIPACIPGIAFTILLGYICYCFVSDWRRKKRIDV
jgi:hypothetical protein